MAHFNRTRFSGRKLSTRDWGSMVKARVHPDTNVISVYEDGFADNETGKTPTVEVYLL